MEDKITITASYSVNPPDRATVVTAIDSQGLLAEFRERVIRTEIDLREKAARAALIELGWTPPAEPPDAL